MLYAAFPRNSKTESASGQEQQLGRPTPSPDQHSLFRSAVLHLFPGAVLLAFVLLMIPVVEGWGFPALFALFIGIALVIVPLELGYLLYQARRTTGTWSVMEVITYRERLPRRQYALKSIPLVLWWIVILAISVSVIDERIADVLFSWMPDSLLEFATFEEDQDIAGWATAVLLVVAFIFNGVVGPVTEELYFRGHLLPRIDRYGRWAPVLNAVLFSLYHFWTPWANPGRILAMLPWVYTVWRTRSLVLSIIVHASVNIIFLLLILAVFLEG